MADSGERTAHPPVRYSDFGADVATHPMTGDLSRLTNGQAVKRAVRNLLMTGQYERPFRPYIGSGLGKYLFEPIGPVTAELIKQSIITTIENFEPRALLTSVVVRVSPDLNAYEATITFGIVNIPESVTLDVVLERVR